MTPQSGFRPYSPSDRQACLAIFEANCPDFFAPNERADYQRFLDATPEHYEVFEERDGISGAFGLPGNTGGPVRLTWILLHPQAQGRGTGSAIMRRVLDIAAERRSTLIHIAASHRSAAFFSRFGALEKGRHEDGWGPGMHRVDMILPLAAGT